MNSPPRKFRVWDGNEMHYPPHDFVVTADGDVYELSDGWGRTYVEVDALFYTGLDDAEDNEIYEGDVVRWGRDINGVVYWNDDEAAYFLQELSREKEIRLSAFKRHDWINPRVIGHRYELPEFLEEVS